MGSPSVGFGFNVTCWHVGLVGNVLTKVGRSSEAGEGFQAK